MIGEPPSLSGGCHDNSMVSLETHLAVRGSLGILGGPGKWKQVCIRLKFPLLFYMLIISKSWL